MPGYVIRTRLELYAAIFYPVKNHFSHPVIEIVEVSKL